MKYQIKYLPDSAVDRSEIRDYLSQYYKSTIKNFFDLLKEENCTFKRVSIFLPDL